MVQTVDRSHQPWRIVGRIALIYFLFSLFWIYVGDQLLLGLFADAALLTRWQTIKGGLFVFFSAILIYVLMYRALTFLRQEQTQAQRLAAMTRYSPAVTICWRNTPGWPVTFVSDNIGQWGYAAADFRNGTILYDQLIHPDDLSRIEAETAEYVAHGPDSYQQQYRLRHGDGHWLWIEDRSWMVRDAEGRITEVHGVLIDISEKIQLREQLRVSEADYQMLFEVNPQPMWVFDLDSLAFLAVNSAAIARYGYSREEFLTMTIRDIRPPEDVGRLEEKIASKTHGLDRSGIWQHITKNGKLLAVEIVSHSLTFEGRRAEVVLAHDITERIQAEQALLERNASLEQFHYIISHDLRTPLVTIESFLGFLEQDLAGSDQSQVTRDMKHIRTATGRMRVLLDDLGKLLLVKSVECTSDISFTTLIDEVRRLVAGLADARDVALRITPAPLALRANPAHLLQIWQNLIENAIKYMGDQRQPVIEVGVDDQQQEPVFFVRDNGVGIEKQFHHKIFGIFNQLDSNSPGSGLGLAMVKRTIELYGGRIWVESPGEGKGSCFRFTLPNAITNQKAEK